jgi:hypothetical protein
LGALFIEITNVSLGLSRLFADVFRGTVAEDEPEDRGEERESDGEADAMTEAARDAK